MPKRLRDLVVDHGVPVWFSPQHVRGAEQWQDEIGEALKRCSWFMILLTPHAVKSMWVKRELNYALMENRYQNRVVPMLFKKCDYRALSWIFPQFQIIDFTENYVAACDQLLRLWKKQLKPATRKRLSRKRRS